MSTFVLDTNIISFHFRGNEVVKKNLREAEIGDHTILLAPFAYYEVKRGLLAADARNRVGTFNILCQKYETGIMDNSLLDIAAAIYADLQHKGRLTDDMDIFIAAFCLKHGHILVTNNTRHFLPIPALLLSDWSL